MGSPGAHFGSKLGSTKGLRSCRHDEHLVEYMYIYSTSYIFFSFVYILITKYVNC